MRIILQASSDADFKWFMRYYRHRFPEGRDKARLQLARTFANLADNPLLGQLVDGTQQRELPILRTPFILFYQIENDQIEILRLWDGRANPGRLTDEGLDAS